MAGKTLRLGLTMAGAVSAGAYTAGVVDYLLETLQKWEDERNKNLENPDNFNPEIPMHRVQICVMGGASAGGMTTAVSLSALREGLRPINFKEFLEGKNDPEKQKDFSKNKFFDTWVNLTSEDMMPILMNNSDIQALDNKNVASLLNSDFVSEIAERAFSAENLQVPELPKYIHPDLEMVLTLTNLQGYQVKYPFKGDNQANITYISTTHRDLAHFKLTTDTKDPARGQIPFRYDDPEAIKGLRDAAMATGAFPIGLKHRKFTRKKKYILNNPLINPTINLDFPDDHKDRLFTIPNVKPGTPEDTPCELTFVDGGLLNNEPFEVTQKILRQNFPNTSTYDDEDHFDNTIIMIDPFPSEVTEIGQFDPQGIMNIVGKVLTTLRSEPLVKADHILKAYNKDSYDRFTISPSVERRIKGGKVEKVAGSDAIACGSLDGFGGFLSRDFREHDFFLGRKNCQSFLRKHFAVCLDTTNEIFQDGYDTPESKERFAFKDPVTGKMMLPIIPDMECRGENRPKDGVPLFPTLDREELKLVEKLLVKRLKAFTTVLRNSGMPYWVVGVVLNLRKKWLAKKVVKIIRSNLYEHGIIGEKLK